MKKHIFKAFNIFKADPVNFLLLGAVALIVLMLGNYVTFFAMLALMYAHGRILVLTSKVKVLSIVAAGAITTISFGGLLNE